MSESGRENERVRQGWGRDVLQLLLAQNFSDSADDANRRSASSGMVCGYAAP